MKEQLFFIRIHSYDTAFFLVMAGKCDHSGEGGKQQHETMGVYPPYCDHSSGGCIPLEVGRVGVLEVTLLD